MTELLAAEEWRALQPDLAGAVRLAVDIEANGFHRYPEQVSLVQVGLPDGRVFLLDPLALDLAPLGMVLADRAVAKVFHAADFDIRSLFRDFGFTVAGLYDTAIAAAFIGARRTGLANVAAEVLEIDLEKPKRLQRLDWSTRPLPDDALAYAAADVAHLLALHDALEAQLTALGRTAWVAEECVRLEDVRFGPPEPPEVACLGVKGARDLTPAGRAVLRELYAFREEEALAAGRPPHWILSNASLLTLAADPAAALDGAPPPGRLSSRSRRRLRQALQRGMAAPPMPWPRRGGPNPWDATSKARLARLKVWRNGIAAELDLDVGVLWPLDHLKRMALAPESDIRAADVGDPPWVRDWQWHALGDSLVAAIANLATAPPTDEELAEGEAETQRSDGLQPPALQPPDP